MSSSSSIYLSTSKQNFEVESSVLVVVKNRKQFAAEIELREMKKATRKTFSPKIHFRTLFSFHQFHHSPHETTTTTTTFTMMAAKKKNVHASLITVKCNLVK